MPPRLRRIPIAFVFVLLVIGTILILNSVVGAAGSGTKTPRSTTTVSIGGQASLAKGGTGITVTVKYSCFPSGYGPYAFAFGDLQVTDTFGHQGFVNWNPRCNDAPQTIALFVAGNFNQGGGAASAFVCGFQCNGASREINIS